MNVINKLTLKHMLLNKKRTIVTVFGIIISVAMFVAVTTFSSSFLKMLQNQSREYYGDWHVNYSNVQTDKLDTIKKDSNTKALTTLYNIDVTVFNQDNPAASLLAIKALETNDLKSSLKLVDGKYPTNEHEIVLSSLVLGSTNHGYKIGDTITLYGGYSEFHKQLQNPEAGTPTMPTKVTPKTYTITGFIEDTYYLSTADTSYCYTYASDTIIKQTTSTNAYVELNNVTNDIYKNSEGIAGKLNVETINYNSSLMYYGVSDNAGLLSVINTIVIIIMVIIMIGAISLIYNAFAISLTERSKYLGMIASVGATKNQKRQSVFFEGLLLGVISIPLGILVGIAGLGITFMIINPLIANISNGNSIGFPLTVSIDGIILAVSFAIITIIISTYIPARRASKITPIEAIRSSMDIKIRSQHVKTGFITRKLFGFEGVLADKNLKRNRGRYRITVISLIVSVVLFLSVSGFTYYLKNAFIMGQSDINFSAVVATENQDAINQFKKIKGVDAVSVVKGINYTASVDKDKLDQSALKFVSDKLDEYLDENGKVYLSLNIYSYDNDYFSKYSKDNNLKLTDNSVIMTKYNNIVYDGKIKQVQVLNYHDGDNLSFETTEGNINLGSVSFDSNRPMGAFQQVSLNGLNLFVSETTLKSISEQLHASTSTNIYFKASDPKLMDQEISKIIDQYPQDTQYQNVAKLNDMIDQILLVVNIFIYGFIISISLISIANIFNTITTSVALRTKEFAMLKSIGMTPKSFNKMIYFESLFYGLRALVIGLPIGLGIMYVLHSSMNSVFNDSFTVPITSFIFVIIAVFVIVGSTLLFSTAKIKKQNIVDGLKADNI